MTSQRLLKVSLAAAVLAAGLVTDARAQTVAPPGPIKSYVGDPGKAGDPVSWQTAEFLRDNGMRSISAEFAYAAGYAGQGMNIGVVDSGTYADHVREHASLDNNYTVADRFIGVVAQGGSTGPTSGFFNRAFNDQHGTHVTGTIGASRDGDPAVTNMHGVAFDADLYVGNTHKTDGALYGRLPANATEANRVDNQYLGNVYRAVAATTGRDGKPVRLITSSWGSQPSTENYGTLDTPATGPATFGLNTAVRFLSTPDGVADDQGNTFHWLNGAIDVAKAGTIIQFTAGNTGYVNPTPRGALPYYMPELEPRWYTTSGINPGTNRTFNADGSVLVPGTQEFNQCGVAKWTCVTAPSRTINSTWITIPTDPALPTSASYASASGTSMAGPHSAAVLGLIMSRFPYMTNEQALSTMETTGRQNATINGPTGAAIQNPTRGLMVQVPDARNGWGTVNLKDAFKGPGQLTGPTALDTKGASDIWSNDISDVAIRARKGEDEAEATAWAATKVAKGWENGVPATGSDQDRFDYATGVRRETARNARIYTGSLTKSGAGTLFLTGSDTWTGPTAINGGKLSVNGSLSSSIDVAAGGTLGGKGTVRAVNVAGGTLQPGLAANEAPGLDAGNVLGAEDVVIGSAGKTAFAIRSGTDYGKLRATGNVVLNGALVLDVAGPVSPGTPLTLITGRTVTGTFTGLPHGSLVRAGGQTFSIAYLADSVLLIAAAAGDGTVGGTVPATLSLVLGTAASFGPFTPGVARDYFASTNAVVTSTAGDALLSVADPSAFGTGHLVNGTFVLPQPLQARARNALNPSPPTPAYNNVGSSASPLNLLTWSAPISNDAVTLEYKQSIGANDPLRTGSYSKTLTYTLSTTTP